MASTIALKHPCTTARCYKVEINRYRLGVGYEQVALHQLVSAPDRAPDFSAALKFAGKELDHWVKTSSDPATRGFRTVVYCDTGDGEERVWSSTIRC